MAEEYVKKLNLTKEETIILKYKIGGNFNYEIAGKMNKTEDYISNKVKDIDKKIKKIPENVDLLKELDIEAKRDNFFKLSEKGKKKLEASLEDITRRIRNQKE